MASTLGKGALIHGLLIHGLIAKMYFRLQSGPSTHTDPPGTHIQGTRYWVSPLKFGRHYAASCSRSQRVAGGTIDLLRVRRGRSSLVCTCSSWHRRTFGRLALHSEKIYETLTQCLTHVGWYCPVPWYPLPCPVALLPKVEGKRAE